MFSTLSACGGSLLDILKPAAKPSPVLEAMSVTWGTNLVFEQDFLQSFGQRNGIKTQFVPNSRLGVYQQLLESRAQEPDLLELDVVWPAILADDLVDLRPYLKDEKAFVPHLLDNYTVRGRLVALPVYIDLGVLYYRPELLAQYGFRHPPDTWEELEHMAARIQSGERRAGNKNFWGYVWQGYAGEGGACNAVEWQASSGAGIFVEPPGRINVTAPRFLRALHRSTAWAGSISPPAEYVYREDDAVNLWDEGETAFMRTWTSAYGSLAERPGNDTHHFAVAPLPGGPGGRRGTLGGLGMGVSKYAANRELAIKALLELTNESNDFARLLLTEGIPTHVAVMERPDVKARSLLLAVSAELMNSMVSRPALILGDKYDQASLQYATAVSSVVARKATPEAAMAELEKSLMKLTGLPAQPN
jgi:trehalose/maltose transport system substrate-binding protein